MVSKRLGAHFGTVLDLAALVSAVAVLVLVLLLQKWSWLQSVWFTSYKFMFCVPLDTKFVTSGGGVLSSRKNLDRLHGSCGSGLGRLHDTRVQFRRGSGADGRHGPRRRSGCDVGRPDRGGPWIRGRAARAESSHGGDPGRSGLAVLDRARSAPGRARRRGGRRTELFLVVPDGVEVEGLSRRYLCTVDSEAAAGYVWKRTRQS